ncbi:metallophosphoesterase family protein [Planctomicrobium sp. SH661]|uniref:metallophosphoesterase family protein n=1 Tax=Planctomicrobium sp. SH661 TaxID=3448124 RepID=UPI003F5B42F2
MPLHALPVSRRAFLARTAAALAGLAVVRSGFGEVDRERYRLAMLSDTHIDANPDYVHRDVNVAANLRQVVGEVLELQHRPQGVLVNGDCAFSRGLPGDYAVFQECVKPLGEGGIPLHITMGNHDARETLYDAINGQRPGAQTVESRHISVIETPVANLFLLDTLTKTNVVTGMVGQAQLEWLTRSLDARPDKPAVLIAHHAPQFTAPEEGKIWSGIEDTQEFFSALATRKQVKAFIFGHTHAWGTAQHEGIHLVNLPPVAYLFRDADPNGWVDAEFRPDGLRLELHTIDADHPLNRQVTDLTWG